MPAPIQSRWTSLHEWLLALLLGANLWWTTLCLGGYRPETMVITAGVNGLLLLVYLAGIAAGVSVGTRRDGWLFVPFLVYAAANVVWVTPVPWLGWQDWMVWAQMIAVFWVCLNGVRSSQVRTFLLVLLLAIGVVAAALGAYQKFFAPDWLMLGRTQVDQFIGRASGPFGSPNSQGALMILLLPVALATALRTGIPAIGRWASGVVATALLAGLILCISRGAWLAIVIACVVWPLLVPGKGWLWRVGFSAGTLAAFALAGVALYETSPKIRERLANLARDKGEVTRPILWRASYAMFRERPLLGVGAGNFNVEFEKYRPLTFRDNPRWSHNDYVNTLADYGATGFVLFFGGTAIVLLRSALARRRNRIAMAKSEDTSAEAVPWVDDPIVAGGFAIGILAFALQLFVDFSLKIPSLAMAVGVIAALLVRSGGTEMEELARPSPFSRVFFSAAALGSIAFMLGFVMPRYSAEASRYGPRRDIDGITTRDISMEDKQRVVGRGRLSFIRATELDPTNAQAWSDRAYGAALWALHETDKTRSLGEQAESAARKAIELGPTVFEFKVRLGVALDMQGRWIEAGDAFTQALRIAPHSSIAWYHLAYHLSLVPSSKNLALSAVATCLRLDPGNTAAEALRQRLAVQP